MSRCRALMISAPASGQGKTTTTAALARSAMHRGLRVRIFKVGPDFIDPMIHAQACGQAVYQLDLWMGGVAHCRRLLEKAASEADLILIEGVMGLYDGTPSSAELAILFGVPVLAVIDGAAMAQTFGAIAYGLSRYRENLPFLGVVANRVGNAYHAQLLAQSLPPELRFLGALPPDEQIAIPDRHLGLVQASEIADLDQRLDRAAAALGEIADFDAIPLIDFAAPEQEPLEQALRGVRIGIASDAAFSFVYRANLDLLEAMGASLHFFSPLADAALPLVDALYLPGGYPELHAARLAENLTMLQALRRHHADGKPIVAECGGMMLLFERLIDLQGNGHTMAGLLPGEVTMQHKLQSLALQAVETECGEVRGHSFHYSSLQTTLNPSATGTRQYGGEGEHVYRQGRLWASYVHLYLPSNPAAAAQLFGR